ncbi:MAG: P-loop ATPase, partial [Rhodospirillaceae bacterium]|nr:P-loop ATPase [Rhodospirillaceae bacterium]
IRCGRIDLEALRRDRDQLWAEAVALHAHGAIWWIEDAELKRLADAEQEERYQSDAWDGLIDRWLVYDKERINYGNGAYDDWRDVEVARPEPLADVSVGEILKNAIGIEPAKWTKGDQMRVGAYLKARGWERYRCRINGSLEWRHRSPG